jgi:hypothetical protein
VASPRCLAPKQTAAVVRLRIGLPAYAGPPWRATALPRSGACHKLAAMARTAKQRATLDALRVRIVDLKVSATTQVPTAWNKEQAELLLRFSRGARPLAYDDCRGPALDALIAVGFVKEQGGDRVALTFAGKARARELLRSPPQPRH